MSLSSRNLPGAGAKKFVSNFLFLSITFSPVKPPPAVRAAIALK
jgi:hypothetical protein